MKCLLCNRNEADQTGAHIFPAWLTATAFDKNGRTRDYEVIYSISPSKLSMPYFGKSVQPEKISEQIGRELTDQEIQEQQNNLIVNNLWCRTCERRFKIVEDYFLEYVDRQINDFSKCNNTGILELKDANKYIIRLFLYSLIFRAYISEKFGFFLIQKTYNKLKHFLDYYIKNDLNSTTNFIASDSYKDQILKFPIRLFKTENEPSDSKGWIFIHDRHWKPYCFILNNYFMQFYGKGNRANFKPESFFGISSIITRMPSIRNYKENIFKIGLLNKEAGKEVIKKYTDFLMKIQMHFFTNRFVSIFKRKFKYLPNEFTKKLFLKELIDNDLPMGNKYTNDKFIEAFRRTIIKINALPPTRTV
jgi:hypothetical protein